MFTVVSTTTGNTKALEHLGLSVIWGLSRSAPLQASVFLTASFQQNALFTPASVVKADVLMSHVLKAECLGVSFSYVRAALSMKNGMIKTERCGKTL